MRLLPSSIIASVFLLIGACSLINAPDDVVLHASGGSSTTGATTSSGGDEHPAGGDGQTMSNAGNSSGGDGSVIGNGGAFTGGGGEVGTAGEAPVVDPGPGPKPTTGVLALASQDDKKARYVSVLNARTGKELAIEPLPIAALAYDEVALRHAWFVFTASTFPAQPTGTADLEVRHFDDVSGRWFVVGRATALPPPVPEQLVLLNNRLAYLSHRVVGGKAVSALTVLDTTDLTKVVELTSRTADAGESYVGLTGDRGSEVNAGAPGGRLRLMIASGCTTDCALTAQQITVATSLTNGVAADLGRFTGQAAFARAKTEDKLYAAFRSNVGVQVHAYSGADLGAPTVVAQLAGFVGNDVGGFVLSECEQAGIVTDVAGKQLIAFNLVSGMSQTVNLMYPGAPLYFETFSSTVLSIDPTAAPGSRAFEVSKSGATNVAVNDLSIWKPTNKFMPLTAAMRRAESFKCP